MAIPFYSDIDLNNNKIKNFTVDTLDQAPTNPNKGQQYYDTTDNKLYYWNGTEWVTGSASASSVGDTLPIGSTLEWFSTTIPDNWLVCDGSAVSRTTYSDLFAVIGTTFGEGDGSTTFNLPNTKGRTIVGLNADDADFNTIGKTIGEKTHTLTVAEMPKHNHKNPIDSFVNSDWQVDVKSGGHVSYKAQGENYETTSAGGSQPHNNIQPSFIGVYIIKAKQSAGLVATVVDNLTSTSSTNALSANQGKILNEKIETLTSQKVYSTEEKETGEIWIDGKTIYQKTIKITSLASNYLYSHGISNLGEIIDMSGSAYFPKQGWQPLQRIVIDAVAGYSLGLGDVTKSTFLMQVGSSYNGFTKAYVTIKYTKT